MKLKIGDYLIETDERQFIVKTKKVVEENRLAKEENIGKEYWQAVAYCTTLDSALKFAPQQVIRSNNDALTIIEKLEQIHADIKELSNRNNIENTLVPKAEYEALIEDSNMLGALRCAGVDSWDGYSHAIEMMGEEDNE